MGQNFIPLMSKVVANAIAKGNTRWGRTLASNFEKQALRLRATFGPLPVFKEEYRPKGKTTPGPATKPSATTLLPPPKPKKAFKFCKGCQRMFIESVQACIGCGNEEMEIVYQ